MTSVVVSVWVETSESVVCDDDPDAAGDVLNGEIEAELEALDVAVVTEKEEMDTLLG